MDAASQTLAGGHRVQFGTVFASADDAQGRIRDFLNGLAEKAKPFVMGQAAHGEDAQSRAAVQKAQGRMVLRLGNRSFREPQGNHAALFSVVSEGNTGVQVSL